MWNRAMLKPRVFSQVDGKSTDSLSFGHHNFTCLFILFYKIKAKKGISVKMKIYGVILAFKISI